MFWLFPKLETWGWGAQIVRSRVKKAIVGVAAVPQPALDAAER